MKEGLRAELHQAIGHTAHQRVSREPGPSAAMTQSQHAGRSRFTAPLPSPSSPSSEVVSHGRRCPAWCWLLHCWKAQNQGESPTQQPQGSCKSSKHVSCFLSTQLTIRPSLPGRQALRIALLICPARRGMAQFWVSADRGWDWEFRFCDLSAWGLC